MLRRVGADDEPGQHRCWGGADDPGNLVLAPSRPHADDLAVLDNDRFDGSFQQHRRRFELVGEPLNEHADASVGIDVPHRRTLRQLVAVAVGHRAPRDSTRQAEPQGVQDAVPQFLAGHPGRQGVGTHARPGLHERDGDRLGERVSVGRAEPLRHRIGRAVAP